jgi:hypothetical protein
MANAAGEFRDNGMVVKFITLGERRPALDAAG